MILFSKVFDGISDLVAGHLVENTHTKTGSARPWLLRCAFPLVVSIVLLFTVPDCGTVGKLVYIFVSYNFAMTVCYTLFSAAMNALPLYATTDIKSRSSAFAIRAAVAGIVQMLLVTFFMNIVEYFGGDQRAWIIFSVIIAVISGISSIITYFSMEENANSDIMEASEKPKDKIPVWVSVKALLRNKYWLLIIALLACILFHQIATLTVGVYYATYVLNDTLLAGRRSEQRLPVGCIHRLSGSGRNLK